MTVVACGGAAENSATGGDTQPEVAAVQAINGDWKVTARETADVTLMPAAGTIRMESSNELGGPDRCHSRWVPASGTR
jgi:hypothetical protein